MEKTNVRHIGLELLRIVAMLMIVTIHCLTKSGALYLTDAPSYYLNWGVYSLCIVAVNCYVLISGYFLCDKAFSLKKILLLWCKVIIYSIIISLFVWGFHLVEFSLSDLIKTLFPVFTRSYWFVTSYIVLYFLFPFLNKLINSLSKKQMGTLIIIMFIVFCLWSNLLSSFFITPDMTSGYGIIWFVFLYFVGAYIKRHFDKKKSSILYLILFLISALVAFTSKFGVNLLASNLGFSVRFSGTFLFDYNSFTSLVGALMLFLIFLNINIKASLPSKIITSLASLTFGVYLIHNHILLKTVLWPDILKLNTVLYDRFFLLYALGAVILVYVICSLAEFIIKLLFSPFKKSSIAKKLDSINLYKSL